MAYLTKEVKGALAPDDVPKPCYGRKTALNNQNSCEGHEDIANKLYRSLKRLDSVVILFRSQIRAQDNLQTPSEEKKKPSHFGAAYLGTAHA